MLIKVTVIIETVACVETDDFNAASIQAREIISKDSFEALREDLSNIICDELPMATKEVKSSKDLPDGWDEDTIPWIEHNGEDSKTCGEELGLNKCSECGK
jgi:hypothetical protein